MPRDGSGAAHNKTGDEPTESLVHGATNENDQAASGVDRSNKAAPMPEGEKGEALEGLNASGGGDTTTGSGKGPIEPTVNKN